MDEEPSDIPAKIGKPVQRALASAGIADLERLSKLTEKELSKRHGIGPKAIGILREALAAKRSSFPA